MKISDPGLLQGVRQIVERLAMMAVLAVELLAVGLTIAGIPARMRELAANIPIEIAPSWMAGYTLANEIFLAAIFFGAAGLIAFFRPKDPLAVFIALSLVALGATETGMTDALINPMHNPRGVIWHMPVYFLRSLAMASALILLYVFPDGRFTPRWTKPLAIIWIVLNIAWIFFPRLPFNPNDGPTWRATPLLSMAFGVGWFSTGIAAQLIRYRSASDPIVRLQTKWTAAGMGLAVLGTTLYYGYLALVNAFPVLGPGLPDIAYLLVRPPLQSISVSMFPICLGIAILRYRLWDIDILINRTLVYGALTALVAGIYILVVDVLSALLQTPENLWTSLIATTMVAVLFQPLRERLQRRVNRLMYGDRDDPYRVISALGRRLEATLLPEEALTTMVETLAGALRLPYAAILLRLERSGVSEWEAAATVGEPPSNQAFLELPLRYQGESIGKLMLAPRAQGESFSPADFRLLDDLARQAGFVVQAARLSNDLRRLTAELQQAREAMVLGREEERRRIRRDLHDGLGPVLAGLTFRLYAARNLLPRDLQRTDALLSQAIDQTQQAIGNIRRLVYNLRPPALDQLGLALALNEEISQLQHAGVQIFFKPPGHLPPLPAAVEVAAYRIILEAVTNVVRHAHARRCIVRLWMEAGALHLKVRDDGRGLLPGAQPGTGLATMHERAAELGGVCLIESRPGGGVTLQVRLPVGSAI